ncbi:ankyrin repeat and SOCS box protein 9 [Dermacentor silvarum]|uniref:ankyrin repeat and SOCS box protein 9 n=1 Tax=Dermacentor silvarum TaxID=543639 RepID=UPI002100E6B6|nr:ankyrin repeat and SOCS box protein 9 [Dermacentor silvarum]
MQPAEPPVPQTHQFLRPTIEIDRSDILHTAKPEIDEGDFGVGLSYTKMTEAEFVARLSIHEAARTGDLHVIKLLLKSDPKRMETVDERGWTPIHLAAANGHAEVVRYLAVEGADVAALDPTSYTAMHLAAMNGHNACLEVLLKVGADVDNITADGFTPLHLAALNNYADCVRTLLSWGANLAVEGRAGPHRAGHGRGVCPGRRVGAALRPLGARRQVHAVSKAERAVREQRPEAFDPKAGADGSSSHGQAVTAEASSSCLSTFSHWDEDWTAPQSANTPDIAATELPSTRTGLSEIEVAITVPRRPPYKAFIDAPRRQASRRMVTAKTLASI